MATPQERNRGLGAYSTPGVDVKSPSDTQFVPIGQTSQVVFRTTQLDPPSYVYIGREDKMLVTVISPAIAQQVNVAVRVLRPDGTVIANVFNFQYVGPRNISQFVQELTEGFLLSVVVSLQTTIQAQRAYATVQLLRGIFANGVFDGLICKGYFSQFSPLGWSSTNNKDTYDGQGATFSITGATPAVGNDISETMPTPTRRRLRDITATLTTGAGVANREVTLVIDDGINILAQIPSTFTQLASLAHRYTFGLGLQTQAGAQALVHTAPLVDLLLQGLWRIRTITTNIQAADQWSPPQYQVEEWIDI